MDYEKTGRLIAQYRQKCGLTQIQLAEKIGVSNRTVSKWERGKGFPDVSLLEPLADHLGITVVELLQGERSAVDAESDMQVREAMRIAGAEARKTLRQVWKGICLTLLAAFLLFCGWKTYEFFATNGDGFVWYPDTVRGVRETYESNCKLLPEKGVFRIEVISHGARSNVHYAIIDPDALDRLVGLLAETDVKKEYRDWGPESLQYSLLVYASGYTRSDYFVDTQDYGFELTFPAFSAEGMSDTRAENDFYYYAEINGEEAWKKIEELLRKLPKEVVS